MRNKLTSLAFALGAFLAAFSLTLGAQTASQGGSFLPTQNYTVTGVWTMSGGVVISGTSTIASGMTITSPTITSPSIAAYTMTGTGTIGNGATITTPILSGSVTGTYTLAGTPTITSPIIATIVNTGTLTLPTATGGVPVLLDCGATGVGNQTCAPVAATAATKVYSGSSTLSSNAAVITFPTAFAATSSYQCVADDITTRANPVQMLSTSGTTATITNTTGASDVINWVCAGY